MNTILRRAERDNYEKLIIENKGNMRKSWQIIKSVINKNKKVQKIPKFFINNHTTTDKDIIANAFNSSLVNTGSTLAKLIPETGLSPTANINCISDTMTVTDL